MPGAGLKNKMENMKTNAKQTMEQVPIEQPIQHR